MGTLEQITKLIDAGYTKDEIVALFKGETKEEAPANPAPAEETKKDPEPPAAAAQPQSVDKLDAAIDKMDKLADSIAKLAIMNSQQPAREGTQEFLAKIINPHWGEDK